MPGCTFSPGYWAKKAADDLQRIRSLVRRYDVELAAQVPSLWKAGSLAGWIYARVARGQTDKLEDLGYAELHALIQGLRSFARQHGVFLDAPRPRGWEPEHTIQEEAPELAPAPF